MYGANEIQYACRDCGFTGVVSDYGEAQEFFDEHAERGHEVELVNLSAIHPERSKV